MIAKVTRGNRMAGLVAYLFGPGRHEEHRDPHLVAGWSGVAGDGRLSKAEQVELSADLDAPRRLHDVRVKGGSVWQCSLRNADDDQELDDATWRVIAEETITRLGFEGCRWGAVRHAQDHIHLAVMLVREDGSVASLSNDYHKLSAACADFQTRYGLVVRAQRGGAGMPGLTRGELERSARLGQEAPRTAIARKIRAASAAARGEAEFVERARSEGLLLRARWAAGGKTKVIGYAVAQRPVEPGAPPVWFGGGKLAPDLTLPRLRTTWPSSDPAQAVSEWSKTAGGRDLSGRTLSREAWEQAGTVVDEVRARLASIPVQDAAGWAAAAGEAAGTLASLAARLEPEYPGGLSRAADVLAAVAQTPHGAHPARRPAALAGMGGVTRTAREAVVLSGGGYAAAAVLLTRLGRLTRAIQQAHEAAGRAEQARRSAVAAQEMLTWLQETTIPAPAAETRGPVARTAPPVQRAPGRPPRGGRPEDGRTR